VSDRDSGGGVVAGCRVASGALKAGLTFRVLRDGAVVHEGRTESIKRAKLSVRPARQSSWPQHGVLVPLSAYQDVCGHVAPNKGPHHMLCVSYQSTCLAAERCCGLSARN